MTSPKRSEFAGMLSGLRIKEGEVGILWLGQNSYVLKNAKGTTVAIDPYLSRDKRIRQIRKESPVKPEEFRVDYVFCTHDHWDHTDPIALPVIAEKFPKTVILGPQESCSHLKELGVEPVQLKALKARTVYSFKGFTVTPHNSALPEEEDTTHFGYVFDFEGIKVYNMGDTFRSAVDNPEHILGEVAKASPDVAMFPITGDTPYRKPEDAFRFALAVKPKVAIPCHYDCFSDRTIDPQRFVDLFKDTQDIWPVVIPFKGTYVYRAQ